MSKIKLVVTIFICTIFCGLFFAGSFFVDSETILKTENRKVTQLKMLTSLKKSDIRIFFTMLDSFIADRLLLKDDIFKLVSLYYNDYFFEASVEQVVKGKEGWFYLGNNFENVVNKHVQEIPLLNKNTVSYIRDIKKIDELSKSVNADFYFIVSPDKHGIYYEYLPDYLKQDYHKEFRYSSKAIAKLSEENINIIDLYDLIKSNKNLGNLYFKIDSHWNLLASDIAFKKIYKIIKDKSQNINIADSDRLPEYKVEKSSPVNGDLIFMSGITIPPQMDDYNYIVKFKTDPDITWKIKGKEEYGKGSVSRYINQIMFPDTLQMKNKSASNRLKLLVMGDSFFYFLSPFFNASFSDILYMSNHNKHEYRERVIREFKPDIVIFETVERFI